MNLIDIFKKDRNQEKDEVVSGIVETLLNGTNKFSPIEVTEIYNRVGVRIFERNKESRSKLIKEAREHQEALEEMKIQRLVYEKCVVKN